MSLLIESIKLLNGEFYNLFYHEQRMRRSLQMLCGIDEDVNLERFLKELNYPASGFFKCRITYDENSKDVEFIPYEIRPVRTLKIVEHDRITYDYKYKNRRTLDKLFKQREACDDILIIRKGLVTDTSYANIAFRKNKTWITPWSPLLKGTMRQKLIENNHLKVEEIARDNINSFEACKLFNAMLEFDGPEIDVKNIVF